MAHRYFVPTLPEPGPFRLEGELAHHLGTVLRARVDEEVLLGDGRGRTARARVDALGRRWVQLEIGAVTTAPRPVREVHLAVALPRATRTEWLFEHGTEVGVDTFWPLLTERTRPAPDRSERWSRLVLAAAGQCDRAWLPEIRPPRSLEELLADQRLPDRRYLADPAGGPPRPGTEPAMVLIGPEGGFSEAELTAIRAAGFAGLRLGPHVLRTETAALVGAALLAQ